jgi:hypothetical protein
VPTSNGLGSVKRISEGKSVYDKDLKKKFMKAFGERASAVNSGGKWWEGIALK